MPNNTSIGKKGTIEQIYEGDQTYGSVKQSSEELSEKAEELRKKNKNVYILIDLSGMGKTTAGSRRASVELLKHVDFDKIALFGGSAYVRHLVGFVVSASGKSKKVKVFKEKKQAKNWLKKKEG